MDLTTNRPGGHESSPRILVVETVPDIAPGLRFELGDQSVATAVTRACDAEEFFQRYPASLLIWNLPSDTSAVFEWLTRCLTLDRVPRTIVCRCGVQPELQSALRMLGVVSLWSDASTHLELATLCRRLLRTPGLDQAAVRPD